MKNRLLLYGPYLFIAGVCLLVYLPVSGFHFTNLDDDTIITTIVESRTRIGDAFTRDAYMREDANGFYRPLQTMTFMLDCAIGNGDPRICHITNLLLFCLGCCSLLWLLRSLGYPGLAVTLLFSVHPLFTQAVAWIPGRGDVLFFLFGVSSIAFLIDFVKTGDRRRGLAHLLAFCLALLSKETAVVLPAVYAAYLAGRCSGWKRFFADHKALLLSWTVVAGGYLLLRAVAVPGLPDGATFGLGPLVHNLAAIPEVAACFLLPIGLSVLPSYTAFRTIAGLSFLAAVALVLIFKKDRRREMALFGSVWFIAAMLPGMLYRFGAGSAMYDYLHHRALFPLVGFLVVLIECIPAKWRTPDSVRKYAVVSMLLVILSIASYRQSRAFAEPGAFFDQAVQTNPQSALAYKGRGGVMQNSGNLQAALRDYDVALRILPDYPLALYNRHAVKTALNDITGAADDLAAFMRLQPSNANLFRKRALLKSRIPDLSGARLDYDEAIRLASGNFELYNERGVLKNMQGDIPGALDDLNRALALGPPSPALYYNIGCIKFGARDTAGACAEWKKAGEFGYPPAEEKSGRYCR